MDNFVKDSLVIGKVIKIKPYAAFLEFSDGRNGLLHISEISDSYIRDIEKFVEVGDDVKVAILEVDPNDGFLRVSLKRVPNEEAYSTHVNENKRENVIATNDEFKTLREKMPEWIETTLEKIKEGE